MARPIEPLPVLSGDDAKKFIKAMQALKPVKFTDNEKKIIEHCNKLFEKHE